jgi:hypothetical protein
MIYGKTDVFTVIGRDWMYSPGGTTRYQKINSASQSLEDLR